MIQQAKIKTRIQLPREFCELDAIRYVASRYGTSPEQVLEHYLTQTGTLCPDQAPDDRYELEPNEIALFRDLGVQPSVIEIV